MQSRPSSDGTERLKSAEQAIQLEQEWSAFLLFFHREMVRVCWMGQNAALPVQKLSATLVFLQQAEEMLFPTPKVTPAELKNWEKGVHGHQEIIDNILKANPEISRSLFLIKQRLSRLVPQITKHLL